MKTFEKILIILVIIFVTEGEGISENEWDNAGLLSNTPKGAQHLLNVDNYSGTDDERVRAALSDARNYSQAGNTSIIYFPARTFYLQRSIRLQFPDSNIVFQGDGSNVTTLKFTFNHPDSNCFFIVGEESDPHSTTLTSTVPYFTKNIQAYNLSGLDVGDWFRLSEYNHDVWWEDVDWATGCVGQISRLVSKNGNNGTMEDYAGRTYMYVDPNNLRIYRISPVKNIGLENLKIWRNNSGHGAGGIKGISVHLKYAINCWIKGVHFYQTCKHHLQADYCAHIHVSGCYFQDARYFEQGGYAYGVQLTGSTSLCLIENNIFNKLRHAMMVQAGANLNVFAFNYSYKQYWEEQGIRGPICGFLWWPEWCGGDICLHGNYPFCNLFEQNWSCIIVGDGYHGPNGPNNFFIRNMTYDDERGDYHAVNLHDTPDSQVGGCMCTPDRATIVNFTGDNGNSIEWFGYFEGSGPIGHTPFYLGQLNTEWAYLALISYFYDSEPDFLQGNFSWPSIGPKLGRYDNFSSISQNIPARYRFQNSSIKTYIGENDLTIRPYYLSGTINQNLTLEGWVYITGDVTIASGYTLTFQPGTIVRSNANTRITVNGTLKAEGTASQKITFTRSGTTGAWYGIRFQDSSVDANCIIKYCDIQYASYGVYCDHANPKIENNTFSNNTYAIYLYYSSSSIKNNAITNDRIYSNKYSPYMDNNLMDNSSQSYGLYLYNWSSPYLFNNTIRGSMYDYAVKASFYCSPQFGTAGETSTFGYNRIENSGGDFSLLAENHSHPFLGSTSICIYPNEGEKNTVKGSDVAALAAAHSYSTVDADYVWWGQYPAPGWLLYADGTSEVNYDYALQSDPGGGSSLGKVMANNSDEPLIDSSILTTPAECDSLWKLAENFRNAGESDSAITVYKTLIDQFSYTPKAHYSLVRIITLSNTKAITETNDYLVSLTTKGTIDIELQASAKEILVSNYCDMAEFKTAIQTAEQILQQFPKSEHEYTTLFNLFNIYQKDLADESNAKKYLEILKTDYPDHELTQIAQFDMGEPVEWKLAKRFVPQPQTSAQTVVLPEDYRLGANYPNPFNPTTIIPFDLPEAAFVKLTIYDLLGREVVTLVNTNLSAGYQQAAWDGRDRFGRIAANGVYIYKIQANRFSQSRKLLLLK